MTHAMAFRFGTSTILSFGAALAAVLLLAPGPAQAQHVSFGHHGGHGGHHIGFGHHGRHGRHSGFHGGHHLRGHHGFHRGGFHRRRHHSPHAFGGHHRGHRHGGHGHHGRHRSGFRHHSGFSPSYSRHQGTHGGSSHGEYYDGCRTVYKNHHFDGRPARISGQMCYDEHGKPYIVPESRELVEYYD